MHQGCDSLNQYVAKYDQGVCKRNLAVRQVPFFASMGTGSQIAQRAQIFFLGPAEMKEIKEMGHHK